MKLSVGKPATMSDDQPNQGLVGAESGFHAQPVDGQMIVFKPGSVARQPVAIENRAPARAQPASVKDVLTGRVDEKHPRHAVMIDHETRRMDSVPFEPAVEVRQRVRLPRLRFPIQQGVLQRIARFVDGENLRVQLSQRRPVAGVTPVHSPFLFFI